MSKNYISISKDHFNKVADETLEVGMKTNQLIQSLESIKSFINLTDEEIAQIKNTVSILENKMDLIEDLVDDENNQFFNAKNLDVE